MMDVDVQYCCQLAKNEKGEKALGFGRISSRGRYPGSFNSCEMD